MDSIPIKNFPLQTTLLIKRSFLMKIRELRKYYNLSMPKLYAKFPYKKKVSLTSFKNNLEVEYPCYIRLDVLFHICKTLTIPLRVLERAIIAYRTKKSRIIIRNPTIPIKVSPIFYMLIAHLMGDGGFIRFKTKKTIYSGYRQYNEILRRSFLDKAEYVFGNLSFPRDYISKSTRIYLPECVSLILMDYVNYPTEKFLSRKARIPEKFFKANRMYLVALLTAFIIDKGNVDSGQICIRLINKKLITDLAEICKRLGYDSTIGKRSPSGMYNFYILQEGLKKYWKDYKQLKRQYVFLTMNYKEEALQKFIQRKKKFYRIEGMNVNKNTVVKLLKRELLSAKEIAYALRISRQGAKYHLDILMRLGIVKRVRARRGFNYALVKDMNFKETKVSHLNTSL